MDLSRLRGRVSYIAAFGVTAVLVAQPAWAALDKCQAAIEKNAGKFQASVLKALVKCVDGYQKNVVKAGADPTAVTAAIQTSATGCQGGLAKVSDTGNATSAISKTLVALNALTNPAKLTCSDTELLGLGHFPTGVGGDHWARLTLLGAIKEAYATENTEVGIFEKAMIDMAGAATPCTECAKFAAPPCQTHACVLGGATGATTVALGVPISVALSGVQFFDFCEFPGVLTNEIGVLGTSPARNFKPSTITLGMTTINVCSSTLRTTSIVNCGGGSMPSVNITNCQDSSLTDNGGASECPTAGLTFCQPNADANTGGACVTFTTGAPAAGQSVAIATTTIRLSTGNGPDGVPCTPDDPYTGPPAPATIPVTSGTATATVLDYDNAIGNDVTAGPVSGSAAPSCAQLRSSNISSGSLVTAFPSADTAVPPSPLADTVTSLKLACS
jgi:hypothetical protein